MSAVLARALMAIAGRSFGANRAEWNRAMQAEYDWALADGRPLRFAFGCMVAALREMPADEIGRFRIAKYVLSLGLIIPVTLLTLSTMLAQFGLLVDDANRSALPSLGLLLLLLGAAHLRIAWQLLDCDWSQVATSVRMAAAVTVTLAMFSGLVFFSAAALFHAAIVAIELGAILVLAQWHALLSADGSDAHGQNYSSAS